jgi:iron complex outermembrane receptor protein
MVARNGSRTAFGWIRWGLVAGLVVATARPSHAESTPPEPVAAEVAQAGDGEESRPRQIEEIVVTAQKREQTLQDVPVAVSAITENALQQTNTTGFSDLGKIASGITVTSQAGGLANTVRIRGIGNNRWNEAIRPSVGIFIDDVPIPRLDTAFTNLADMERIEVLKGPQATLFGKEVSAGAIVLHTKKPSTAGFESYANLNLGRGTEQRLEEYRLGVNVPLGERVALRMSTYFTKSHDGIENVTTGDETEAKTNGLRMRLLFQPTDDLEAIISYERHYMTNETMFERVSWGQWTTLFASGAPVLRIPLPGATYLGPTPGATSLIPADPFDFENQSPDLGGLSQNEDRWALHLSWNLAPQWTFDSITSFQQFDRSNGEGTNLLYSTSDGSFTPFQFLMVRNTVDDTAKSQELRLAYDGDDLTSVFGVFLARTDLGQRTDLAITQDNEPFPGFVLYVDTPLQNLQRRKIDDIAFFTHNTYRFSDEWDVTFGLRHSMVRKAERTANAIGGGIYGVDPDPYVPRFANRWKALSWTAKLGYHWSDDLSFYAGYDRGFKAGGLNDGQIFVLPLGPNSTPTKFDEEIAHNYEAGFKGMFLDRTLRVSGSVYFQRYEDYQVELLNPVGIGFIIGTDAKVESKGAELELQWLATEHLSFDGSVSYVRAEFEKYRSGQCTDAQKAALPVNGRGSCTQDMTGKRVNDQSPWTWNLNAHYENALLDTGWNWYGRGELAFRDDKTDFPSLDRQTQEDDYLLVNARLGVRSPDDRWDVALWGKNLTNREYISQFVQGFDGLFGVQAVRGDQRMLGVNVSFRY